MAIFRLPDDYKGDFFRGLQGDDRLAAAYRADSRPVWKSAARHRSPSWVEDDQFDIDRHIFRGSLPAPHDRATLERIVGWMHASCSAAPVRSGNSMSSKA
jgi:hypothetical protein